MTDMVSIMRDGEIVQVLASSVPASTPRVPEFVTRRQAKRALLDAGLYSAAETAILSAGTAAVIDWQDADTFRRDNPLIEAMRLALSLTHTQVDDLFRAAALIA